MANYRDHLEMLPGHIRDGVLRYIEQGVPTGDFLRAVFSNDLKGAVCRADSTNQRAIVEIVQFMVWYAPAVCQGSPERYENWIEIGGLEGRAKQPAEQEAI